MSDFRHRAACRDVDPELFFPIGSGTIAEAQTARAKAVCRTCAVIGECLRWAIDTGQAEGVWGGVDAAERRARITGRPSRVVTAVP
jgi:WhiB family redox-sensing transcriptional regulator